MPKRINQLAQQRAGIGCWIGGMLESAVGAGICVELAAMSNMVYPSDLFPSAGFIREDFEKRTGVFSPAKMRPSMAYGNAYVPEEAKLKQRTVAQSIAE